MSRLLAGCFKGRTYENHVFSTGPVRSTLLKIKKQWAAAVYVTEPKRQKITNGSHTPPRPPRVSRFATLPLNQSLSASGVDIVPRRIGVAWRILGGKPFRIPAPIHVLKFVTTT